MRQLLSSTETRYRLKTCQGVQSAERQNRELGRLHGGF
jgi:hypothetical protein